MQIMNWDEKVALGLHTFSGRTHAWLHAQQNMTWAPGALLRMIHVWNSDTMGEEGQGLCRSVHAVLQGKSIAQDAGSKLPGTNQAANKVSLLSVCCTVLCNAGGVVGSR